MDVIPFPERSPFFRGVYLLNHRHRAEKGDFFIRKNHRSLLSQHILQAPDSAFHISQLFLRKFPGKQIGVLFLLPVLMVLFVRNESEPQLVDIL